MLPRSLPCAVLLAAAITVVPAAAAPAAGPVAPDTTVLVSGQDDLATPLPEPDGDAATISRRVQSDDGRYVLFSSSGEGLPGAVPGGQDVFRKDLQTGAVVRVSVPGGVAAGTLRAEPVGLSDDGRHAAFLTSASASPLDANTGPDIYVRDLLAGTTTLASRVSGGGAIGDIQDGDLSGDGTTVAFTTDSTSLDPSVTDTNATFDVYATTVATGATQLVSRGAAATAVTGYDPSLEDDASSATFVTDAPIAGALDTNGQTDVYLRVLALPASTQLVSRVDGGGGAPSTGSSYQGVLSGDGSTVAWVSSSTTIGDGDVTPFPDVHRSVIGSGTTSLVSRRAGGTPGDDESSDPALSDDGRTVGFLSRATNLDAGYPDANGLTDAFVRRVVGDQTELVTRTGPSDAQASGVTVDVDLSGDGLHAAFSVDAFADDLDPRFQHTVQRDLTVVPRVTRTVSRPAGTAAIVNPGGAATSTAGTVSRDGRFVAFTADQPARGLAPGVPAAVRRDLRTGTVVVAGRGPDGTIPPARTEAQALSADGTKLLFSTAVGLDPADLNGITDLYLRDVAAGTTTWVSRADGAAGAAPNAIANVPGAVLSADGRRVAWVTAATNLGDGDTSPVPSVHVRDVAAGRTLLASRGQGPTGAPNTLFVSSPQLDGTGRRVAFTGAGADFGDGGSGPLVQAHIRDLDTGVNRLAVEKPGGGPGNGSSGPGILSADGSTVAVVSQATDLTPQDTDAAPDVLVRDLTSGAITLASRADGPAGASPAVAVGLVGLSADGRRVLLTTSAVLEPGAPSALTNLVLRDLDAGTSRHVSRLADGTAVTGQRAALSPDGRCVTFGVAPAASLQVALRAAGATCAPADPTPSEPGAPTGGGTTGGAPGSGGAPGATDRRAPRVTGVTVTPTRPRRGRPLDVRLRLDEAARVTLTLSSVSTGRRVGTTCRRQTSRNRRRKACERLTRRYATTRALTAGSRSIRFGGRVRGRGLPTGRYVATVVAVDAAGNRSAPTKRRFTVRR
ncbi:hypothetical protein GKE82_01060 [Conexibacter sp. W3-3-2]|uniref:hypothetical protein n=1 Tax=Conexibacter sp. W3-3-2 TaxID=2675227 RepID=UPI0012B91477|nr:hypothetical protein [Conexibacter sp. W3-3-2]MTD42927.1 hypothetical protein [Conexibacter sp. W3-3-2]